MGQQDCERPLLFPSRSKHRFGFRILKWTRQMFESRYESQLLIFVCAHEKLISSSSPVFECRIAPRSIERRVFYPSSMAWPTALCCRVCFLALMSYQCFCRVQSVMAAKTFSAG